MGKKGKKAYQANQYSKAQSESKEAAGQRLVRVYELAIGAAQEQNSQGVRYCLSLLRHTLDPSSSPEVVLTQSQLYNDCEEILNNEDYPQLLNILEYLKGLWVARMRVDSMLQD
ncbi:MAG: hypothetical protein AB3N63_12150 [Puniceicoccaceae bacterium]